jgi:putative solute:sodium symporter small subunit
MAAHVDHQRRQANSTGNIDGQHRRPTSAANIGRQHRSPTSAVKNQFIRGQGMTVRISEEQESRYWRRNVALVIKLLLVWFLVSFGAGILFVDELNQFQIGGYKLGFWFAQQGSIYAFVILVLVYRWRMAALDREFGVDGD